MRISKLDTWGRGFTLAWGVSKRARGSDRSRHFQAVLPLPVEKMTSNGVKSSERSQQRLVAVLYPTGRGSTLAGAAPMNLRGSAQWGSGETVLHQAGAAKQDN